MVRSPLCKATFQRCRAIHSQACTWSPPLRQLPLASLIRGVTARRKLATMLLLSRTGRVPPGCEGYDGARAPSWEMTVTGMPAARQRRYVSSLPPRRSWGPGRL